MTWKFVSAVTLGAALLASAPTQAASCKKDSDCSSGQVCSSSGTCVKRASRAASDAAKSVAPTDESTAGTKRTPYIGWGGIGFYNVGVSVDVPGFGTVSGSSTYFGFHAGGAANLLSLTPDLPLVGWADIAMTLGSDLFFPLAAGAGVRYDKAGPVQLLGGLGFALMPHTGGGTTPLGLRIMGMVLYPIPQLSPNLSAQVQISYDFLSNGFHLFAFTVGAGYAL
jgi:hypothetical protein